MIKKVMTLLITRKKCFIFLHFRNKLPGWGCIGDILIYIYVKSKIKIHINTPTSSIPSGCIYNIRGIVYLSIVRFFKISILSLQALLSSHINTLQSKFFLSSMSGFWFEIYRETFILWQSSMSVFWEYFLVQSNWRIVSFLRSWNWVAIFLFSQILIILCQDPEEIDSFNWEQS